MDNPAIVGVARHGETDRNNAGILQARMDVPLSDEGRRQAVELARVFADAGFGATQGLPRGTVLDMKRKNGECLWLAADRNSIRALEPLADGSSNTPAYALTPALPRVRGEGEGGDDT